MIRKLILALVVVLALTAAAPVTDTKLTLHVAVNGLRNDTGTVYYTLFNQPDGFPMVFERACRRGKVKVVRGKAIIKLGDLPEGRYALGVFHDENGNNVLDTSTFGLPKEGYGFSNNAKARWNGPPRFDDAAFQLDKAKTELDVSLKY